METEVISGRKTLLQRFEIPLDHLDFEYLKNCNDKKEVEKIYRILKSKEEGVYPDLENCAKERLAQLDPENRYLIERKPAITLSQLDPATRNKITEKLKLFREESKILEEEIKARGEIKFNYAPIRTLTAENIKCLDPKEQPKKPKERIKSNDYDQWSRYDADAECLKVDLQEEIQKEKREMSVRARQSVPEFQEIAEEVLRQLTPKEREVLARRYKEIGNEQFQAQEYESALGQYNTSLRLFPTAAVYNNRAITHLKLKKYQDAVEDCKKCLEMEPTNIKALIRQAQGYQGMLWRSEAYEIYCQVLKLDKNNTFAHEQINKIRHQLPKFPPPNTTRIKIVDENPDNKTTNDNCEKNMKATVKKEPEIKESTKIMEVTNPVSTQEKVKETKTSNKEARVHFQIPDKESERKEKALLNFKTKMKEQKQQKEKFKEQMKQMICEDVILLPHHDKRKQEFIIEESKD